LSRLADFEPIVKMQVRYGVGRRALESYIAAEAMAVAFVATRELVAVVAAGIVLSSLDDLIVDIAFLLRAGWQRLSRPVTEPLSASVLASADPGWMAILVPAWDEANVIEAMLRDLTARLDYPHYVVFVGTYANDPATREAAERVRDNRIIGITVPRPGPTSKADCLNTLWRAVLAYEQVVGMRFKAIVLHDAEDVVHRHELKVFDHFIGSNAMVQLPVVPLLDDGSRWIAGHYADEFAEAHGKDILMREAIGAAVPSAGVACAVERGMIGRIAEANGGRPFDPACQVEDYELGMRVAALGGKTRFVRIPGGDGETAAVATREHFPATFSQAKRQKARWLLGIALHGWDRLGWPKRWPDRFMLVRDRKSIVTAMLTALAYVGLLLIILLETLRAFYAPVAAFPPLIEPGSPLERLLQANLGILVWRLGMRAFFTGRTYGWREAPMAVLRTLTSNLINVAAATSALRRYLAIERGRETLRWHKTEHRFPEKAAGC
jgi:bacteriophage N4 adsorption protein B